MNTYKYKTAYYVGETEHSKKRKRKRNWLKNFFTSSIFAAKFELRRQSEPGKDERVETGAHYYTDHVSRQIF